MFANRTLFPASTALYTDLSPAIPTIPATTVSTSGIEIISRKGSKTLGILEVKLLPKKIKYKVQQDLKKITQKKRFKNLKFSSSPVLMGIINLTPDSFSDGGKYRNIKSAYEHSKFLIQKGCKIIDGLDMLIFQAIKSIEIWIENDILQSVDYKKIRNHIIKNKC